MSHQSLATRNELIVPMKGLPSQLDPQRMETIYEMVVNLQIHRGLMRFLPNLSIVPDIAESYSVFDQGQRVRFHLGNRFFSNGTKITANHVVRTFQRLFFIRSGFAADIDYIVGAKEILSGSPQKSHLSKLGVLAINDHTVEFRLIKPVSIFLSHLATVDASILPLKEDLVYSWKNDGGAGPYSVQDIGPEKVNLVSARASTPAKSIGFVEMPPKVAIEAALKGEIDSLDGYTVNDKELKLLTARGWKPSVSTITRQLFLVQNPNRVRKDIRQTIFDAVMKHQDPLISGTYTKSCGLIPNSLGGALDNRSYAAPNISSLKDPAKVTLTIIEGESTLEEMAANLKKLLRPLNVHLLIKRIPMKSYMALVNSRDFEIMLRSKYLDYPDGMSILTYFKSDFSANTFFIEDKKVDSKIEMALGELNREKRFSIYREIQLQILSHNIIVPIVFGSDNHGLWNSKLSNVPAHPLGLQGLPFDSITLRK